VSITSRHHLHHSQNSLIINRSQVIARNTPAPPHQHIHAYKHGTRVTVRDLFGNMPVRVKQRVEESVRQSGSGREWEELRKLVTSLALVWPSPVLIVVRDSVSNQKLQLRGAKLLSRSKNTQHDAKLVAHVCNTLSQAMFISSPDRSKWVSTRASTPRIRIQGAISQEPAPTKAVQFLSLGIEPLSIQYGHSILYDEINRLFENSSFGNEAEPSNSNAAQVKGSHESQLSKSDGFTTKELRGSRKGLDRWPMFFIQIELLDPITQQVALNAAHDIVEDKKGILGSILEVLKAMVLEFLKSHNFLPRTTRAITVFQNRKSENYGNISEGGYRSARGNKLGSQSFSPSQTPRMGSPFDTWSRVKSGRPRPPSNAPEQLCQVERQVSNASGKPSVPLAEISKIDVSSSLTSDPINPGLGNNPPTISRSGKVVRPPFDSLPAVKSNISCAPQSVKNNPSVSGSEGRSGKEQYLEWVNPITKMESIVDGRTGLVTQSTKIDRLTPRIVPYVKPENEARSPIANHKAFTKDTERKLGSSTWIDDLLRNWKNPIYRPTESSIPRVSVDGTGNEPHNLLHGHRHYCSQVDNARAFQETPATLDGRISKEALRNADIIAQVDRKFILIKIAARIGPPFDGHANAATGMLVIVDQHAADERCRIEELLEELCNPLVMDEHTKLAASLTSSVPTILLEKPISFMMPTAEIQLLQMHAQHFAKWGILYDIQHALPTNRQSQEYKVMVKSLPPLITERCTAVPKLLIELLRSEIWKCSEKRTRLDVGIETDSTDSSMKYPWLRRLHSCPQALLEILNSRACRSKIRHCIPYVDFYANILGAIMFNDELSTDQCKALIVRLAECAFPFQCAHGRPSMIPLLNLDSFTPDIKPDERRNLRHIPRFGDAFKMWKHGIADITQP